MNYTFDEIQNELNNYGFNLIQYQSTKELISKDKDGYKYKINLCNLRNGKQPNRFMKNPFALDNFKLYLQKNYPEFELLDDKYINCKTKMNFICHKHPEKGIQQNTVTNIIHSHHACLYCGCDELWERKRTSIDKMKEECQRVGVKFIKRTSKNNECYVNYNCPNHSELGVQSTSWTHFKEFNYGCPHCHKISRGENKIYKYLSDNHVSFIKEHSFEDCMYKRHLKFDFYIPSINLIIEYNGQQHYKPVEIFGGKNNYNNSSKRDKIKLDYCKKNNIELLIIPYWDYDNIEKILEPYASKALSLCEKV